MERGNDGADARSTGDRLVHQRLRLVQQALQVCLALEALGVDLVDLLGARRPRREPAAPGTDADAADGRAVARRLGGDLGDGFAGDLPGGDRLGRQRGQPLILEAEGFLNVLAA